MIGTRPRTRKTIRIHAAEGRLLWEAMRRILCIGEKDIDSKFAGLGCPSYYKAGVKAGLFRPSFGSLTPRIDSWYSLTPLGQQIVKQCIRKNRIPKDCHDVYGGVYGDITVMV